MINVNHEKVTENGGGGGGENSRYICKNFMELIKDLCSRNSILDNEL